MQSQLCPAFLFSGNSHRPLLRISNATNGIYPRQFIMPPQLFIMPCRLIIMPRQQAIMSG